MKDSISSSSSGPYNYRPFIKNITIQQAPSDRKKSGDASNKTFFSNIKAELNNIRTDVNKLVSKDINKTSNNKSYTMGSSAQKFEPYAYDNLYERNIEKKLTQFESNQKNNITTGSYNYQSKVNELNSKLNYQISKNEQLSRQIEQERRLIMSLRDQVASFKQKQMKFEFEISQRNKEIQNQKFLYQRLIREKEESSKIIERLESENRRGSFRTSEKVIQPDLESISKIKNLQSKIMNLEKDLGLQRDENNKQRFEIDNLRQLGEESKKSQNKLDDYFAVIEENKRLNFDLRNLHGLMEQNQKLKQELNNFEKNKQVEIVAISKNFEQKIGRAEAKTYKQLGAGFQLKINELLDENYSLKNKIVSLQSQIEQDNVQISSLRSTVEAYEARDRETGKGALEQQLQSLQQKVMQLQEQKDKMQSEHEYEIMKLQNTIDELKSSSNKGNENKNFNQILKDQINEIENLKERLRERNQIINKLKK